MSKAIDADPIAFRIGQIDTLTKCLLASGALYRRHLKLCTLNNDFPDIM